MATDTPTADAVPELSTPAETFRAQPASFGREWWIVFRHEFRRLLFSPRTLIPMVIYAGFAALTLLGFQRIEKTVDEQRDEQHIDDETYRKGKEDALAKGLSLANWGNEGDAAEIVRDHVPLTIVIFFAISSYFLPLLVAVVSFDQFSELSTRGARYALLRVRRETYVLGKAAASIASVAAFLLVMWLVVAIDTSIRGPAGESPVALREGVRAWALMCIVAIPYLSLTALISSFVRPVLAFVGTLGAWIGLGLGVALVGHLFPWILEKMSLSAAVEPEKKLLLLFPWEHVPKLISRDPLTLARGIVGLLLIAIAGYVATLYVVRRRDV